MRFNCRVKVPVAMSDTKFWTLVQVEVGWRSYDDTGKDCGKADNPMSFLHYVYKMDFGRFGRK